MGKSVLSYGLLAAILGFSSLLLAADVANAISLPRTQSNGKVCRMLLGSPHVHSGRGKARATKAAAQAAAIKRWMGFTGWEYGREWGSFHYAEHKSVSCRPHKRGGWKCKAKAQPCRR